MEREQFILLPSLNKAISVERVSLFTVLCEAPKDTLQMENAANAKFSGQPRFTAE
jgi:hypothetical protein